VGEGGQQERARERKWRLRAHLAVLNSMGFEPVRMLIVCDPPDSCVASARLAVTVSAIVAAVVVSVARMRWLWWGRRQGGRRVGERRTRRVELACLAQGAFEACQW